MESNPEASVMPPRPPSPQPFLHTPSYSKRPPVSATALDESKKNDFEPSIAPARDATSVRHEDLNPLGPAVHPPDEGNNGLANTNDRSDDIAYFKSLPPGYRFFPLDEELVVHYLRNKVMNRPLPRNRIMDVNVYAHNPDELAEMYKQFGEKEWYFFTPRDKKYRNGNRPNRAAGNGYWKATGADRDVCYKGKTVGSRKALVFYTGKPTTTRNSDTSKKTNWIMHEYRVKDAPRRSKSKGPNDMRLDDWVLCRIYKKADKVNAGQGRHKDQNRSISPMIHHPDLDGDHDGTLNDVAAMETKYDDPVDNSMVYAAGYMEQQSNAAAAMPDGGYLQCNSPNFVSNYINFNGPVQHCGSNFVSNGSGTSVMESFGLIPLPPIEGYIPMPFQDDVLDFTYYEDLPPALNYTNNISPYSEMVSLDKSQPPNNSPSILKSPSGNNL